MTYLYWNTLMKSVFDILLFCLMCLQGILVGQLMKRYRKGFIYTYVGDILVSINPFQQISGLYNEKVCPIFSS